MSAPFEFQNRVDFSPADADTLLRAIPAAPGVFALRGEGEYSEPYLTRTADLRRRLRRLLAPPEALDDQGRPVLSKRLNLRDKVRFIDWTPTGSEFESTLVLYCATRAAFGPEQARKRLRLYAPFFLRITLQHQHPRVYVTNRLSRHSLGESFGPFPSRAAAERYGDAVLDLFKLRRCYEDLQVHPDHPGCAYGEMNKCLAPCKMACTPEDYAAESARVHAFFTTRGESMLAEVAAQREAASEAMDFEQAAALHKQWERVKTAASLADELVQPVAALRAVILQEAAPRTDGERLNEAAVFLLEHGRIAGPQRLSTLGVRAVREQTAVGSSLFAQPLMLAAVPLDEPASSRPTITPENIVILSEAKDLLSSESPPHSPASGNLSATSSPATNVSSRPESALFADAVERPAVLSASSTLSPKDRARTVLAQLTTLANTDIVILSSAKDPLSSAVEPHSPASHNPEGAGGFSPLTTPRQEPGFSPGLSSTLSPEDRARTVLAQLTTLANTAGDPDIAERCDFLALFRRWYYRPEKQRAGEVFLPNPDATWPLRRILNGAARVVLGPPAEVSPVEREKAREAAKNLKTKIIHPGREGVEREVPVLPKRTRSRKAVGTPNLSS